MQKDEKLIYVHSDLLLHEEEWDALRKRVLTLKDNDIHNFMYFCHSPKFSDKVSVATIMAVTDTPDFSPHPTVIIEEIRENHYILMTFKTLKQFLSL